jgi:hypothetical protein
MTIVGPPTIVARPAPTRSSASTAVIRTTALPAAAVREPMDLAAVQVAEAMAEMEPVPAPEVTPEVEAPVRDHAPAEPAERWGAMLEAAASAQAAEVAQARELARGAQVLREAAVVSSRRAVQPQVVARMASREAVALWVRYTMRERAMPATEAREKRAALA